VVERLSVEIPDQLIAACAAGDCVLFAGSGISAQAGYPTWRDAIGQILTTATLDGTLTDADSLRIALNEGKFLQVSELLSSRLGPPAVTKMAQDLYGTDRRRLPGISRTLGQIPFDSVVTGNWDGVIERTFAARIADRRRQVLTPLTTEKFSEILRERRFVVLKIFGDIEQPDSLLLTPEEYRREIFANPELGRYLSTLFSTRSIIYAGVSLDGITDFMSAFPQLGSSPRQHVALVPWQTGIEVQAELFKSRWGIELLVYQPSDGHPEVPAFFERLRDRVRQRARASSKGTKANGASPSVTRRRLDWLELENVGPFERLRLDFRTSWTVLLGNNACGKTTVLRAIALALSGDDERATSLGGSLLRAGTSTGSVTLSSSGVPYRTDLIRDGDQVRVRPRQVTPVQSGQWLVLGFPALRGASSRDPSGPSADGSADPTVADMLPLLANGVDGRLDNLKQWIVNAAVRAEATASPTDDANTARALLARIFAILAELTSGVDLRFSRVDRSTWSVLVKAGGVELPVDRLSQGTSAILGWVGTVLQRIADVYGGTELPPGESVLVLVDEIDAHMHPEWQQHLVRLLKRHLPDVELVATTHSPLIVGSSSSDELIRLRRNGHMIEAERLDTSFRGWRADQILTGPAFDLDTTIDEDTENLLSEYTRLLGNTNRNQAEQARFLEIEARIEQRVPGHLQTPAEREAYGLMQEWLVERVASQPAGRKEAILREARKLMADLDEENGSAAR
jgi:hypothetical protein